MATQTQTETEIVEVKDDFQPSFDKAPDLRFTSLSSSGQMVEHKEHLTPPETPRDYVQEPELRWSKIRRHLQEPFSEFFATMVMILFGDGVVAQVILSGQTRGDYQSISWGWGYVQFDSSLSCRVNLTSIRYPTHISSMTSY